MKIRKTKTVFEEIQIFRAKWSKKNKFSKKNKPATLNKKN